MGIGRGLACRLEFDSPGPRGVQEIGRLESLLFELSAVYWLTRDISLPP